MNYQKANKWFLTLLGMISLISYGFLIGKYKIPPYNILSGIKKDFFIKKNQHSDICIYKPNLNILNNDDTYTYKDILKSSFKYKHSIFNDYAYYVKQSSVLDIDQITTPFDYKNDVFSQYIYRYHESPSETLVVLIHGNSSIPDDFFNNQSYLGNSGAELFKMGFDILAPYVTHDSRFQNSRARLSKMKGDFPQSLDINRIINLINKYHPQYKTIHIAGVSYGGILTAQVLKKLKAPSYSDIFQKIGTALSVEGFLPISTYLQNQEEELLFAWNFEMMFPGNSEKQFLDMMENKNFYLGVSSCHKSFHKTYLKKLDPKKAKNQVIYFDGGHEFKSLILIDAIKRNIN